MTEIDEFVRTRVLPQHQEIVERLRRLMRETRRTPCATTSRRR
jgi:hypothetical protein